MLRATAMEIHLTASDLQQALAVYAAGHVERTAIELADGAILVRHKVAVDRLPLAVDVDLRLSIQQVRSTEVRVGVTWSNMPLLPSRLKELALQKAFASLPGRYENGLLTIDLSTVVESLPIGFTIRAIAIKEDGVRVSLEEVVLFPLEPAALVEGVDGALVPIPSQEEAQIPEHQDYYAKLRAKVARFAEERAPEWAKPLLPWVLAVPDFFAMMVRLAGDERVPAGVKLLAGVVIAYIISPIDLIPDAIPIIGEIDDVAVAVFAVDQIAQRIEPGIIQEAWSGEGQVLELVAAGILLFRRVLPERLLLAIGRVLNKR